MSKKVRVVRGWVWPGLIFALLGVLLATFWTEASWLAGTAGVYTPVVYGAGLLLTWRYGRSRAAAVLLGLFMLDVLLRPSGATLEPGVGSVWDASGVLFLVVLPVVAAMKDRGVISPRGLIQVAIIPVGLAGGLMVWAVRPEFLSWTWQDLFPWDLFGLSDAALALGLIALMVTGGLSGWRGHRLDKGFFWVTLALMLALRGGSDSLESTIYLTMAGLMLIVNVLEKSYALSLHDNVTHLPARRALRRDVGRMRSSYALAWVSIDDFKTLHDRSGRDASDRVIRKIANNLRKASAGVFRYSGGQFALLFAGKGRHEVLGDLETLRADIEDFQFPLHPKAAANGKGATIRYPSA